MLSQVSSTWHFVFVHGAMHGAWCWYKIRSLLETQGHKVTCLDLASAGRDTADPNSLTKFLDYNKPLIDFMSSLSDGEKVVLVGHSIGGLSITYCVQEYPSKIMVAIYVCAAMLEQSRGGARSKNDDMYDLVYGNGPNTAPTSILLKEEYQRNVLYNLSPIEDSTLASMLLRYCPLLPLKDAKFEIGKEANKVKRVYIKTLQDNKYALEDQEQMIETWPPAMVLKVRSDHSPFFSTPDQLLLSLLEAVTCAVKPFDPDPDFGVSV